MRHNQLITPRPSLLYLANERMRSSVQFGQTKNDNNAFHFTVHDVWSLLEANQTADIAEYINYSYVPLQK
jgi:hypothetical protein